MVEYLKVADIGEEGAAKVRELEKVIGVHVMAYEWGNKLAKLTDEQRAQVEAVEAELGKGVMLLAYVE